MLKVINLNSTVPITVHDCEFVEHVMAIGEKLNSQTLNWNKDNSLSQIIGNIPVFLLNEKSMARFDKEYKDETGHNEKPRTEYLAVYLRTDCDHFSGLPTIYICPERISNHLENIGFQLLLVKILIHEFAHAIMDSGNQNLNANVTDRFFRWIEEPFANWFVLKYFESYGNGDAFHKVVEFMKLQPKNYQLGWNFFISRIDDGLWMRWRESKSIITNDMQDPWYNFAVNTVMDSNVTFNLQKLFN